MYKEKISAWVDAHKDEMLEDICELCRVNSEKMPAEEDMPFGPGTAGHGTGHGRRLWL